MNSQPITQNIGERLWRLTANAYIFFTLRGVHYKLVIFTGMEYDGASIPRWAWSILGETPKGQHDLGTLLHDLLYMIIKIKGRARLGQKEDKCTHVLYAFIDHQWMPATVDVSRKEADQLMFDVIRTTENVSISELRLKTMHNALKIAGGKKWKKITPNHIINPQRCQIA